MDTSLETSYQAAIEAGKINGVIVCATDAQGKFVYNKALGHRTLLSGSKKPQQTDDVVYLASATKLITAIAVLQAVEDGTLSLTGDLTSLAPELASKQVLTGFKEDGETPILEPATGAVTLEMLLTHSSGVVYTFMNPDVNKWAEKYRPPLPEGATRGVEEAFDYPLAFQPGKSWMYGPGLDWAGRILERATGRTLGEYIEERICKPLGISSAQFFPVDRPELRERMVDLNPEDPKGLGRAVLGGSADMNTRSRGHFGGHGLFMAASDYIKVLRSLLANDGKLLKPETVDSMFENHLSADADAGHKAALETPMGPFFRVGTEVGLKSGYGLSGLLTLEDTKDWCGARTLVWGGGITFAWFIDRTKNLCGITALQPPLPVDMDAMSELKQVFRLDIYRKRVEWEQSQGK